MDPAGADTPAPPSEPSVFSAEGILRRVLVYGIDTAWKYGLDTSFGAIQTICAIVGIIGASTVVSRAAHRKRPVSPLYNRLREEGGLQAWPHLRIRFAANPYYHLKPDQAVILKGRPKEGKTTLLRTSIPWYRRWDVWPISSFLLWRGIYLNGAQNALAANFDMWVTQQMFGLTPQAGAELKITLFEHRHSQWFRLRMEKMRMPFLLPRPCFVIVDQFEELIRRFPDRALAWAEVVVGMHTRDNLARVIFVVNSENGVRSLTHLNFQPSRFHTVTLEPKSSQDLWKLSQIDRELFMECDGNVGMYQRMCVRLQDGQIKRKGVAKIAKMHLELWEKSFNLSYCHTVDYSWFEMPLTEAKRNLAKALATMLHVPEQSPETDFKEVKQIMDTFVVTVKRLNATHFFTSSEDEWSRLLMNAELHTSRPSLSRAEAKVVAWDIKFLLSQPAQQPKSKPRWRMPLQPSAVVAVGQDQMPQLKGGQAC